MAVVRLYLMERHEPVPQRQENRMVMDTNRKHHVTGNGGMRVLPYPGASEDTALSAADIELASAEAQMWASRYRAVNDRVSMRYAAGHGVSRDELAQLRRYSNLMARAEKNADGQAW